MSKMLTIFRVKNVIDCVQFLINVRYVLQNKSAPDTFKVLKIKINYLKPKDRNDQYAFLL